MDRLSRIFDCLSRPAAHPHIDENGKPMDMNALAYFLRSPEVIAGTAAASPLFGSVVKFALETGQWSAMVAGVIPFMFLLRYRGLGGQQVGERILGSFFTGERPLADKHPITIIKEKGVTDPKAYSAVKFHRAISLAEYKMSAVALGVIMAGITVISATSGQAQTMSKALALVCLMFYGPLAVYKNTKITKDYLNSRMVLKGYWHAKSGHLPPPKRRAALSAPLIYQPA